MTTTEAKRAVPEGQYVEVGDGLRVHYQEAGSGPTVVFLHGSGPGASGYSNFHRNYGFLAAHGFRTLAPDTLGFGYSSKPDNVDYGLDFTAGGVERFLKAMGVDKCTLVGNSHGGAMALRLAARRPDLVERLVVMAPGGLEERDVYVQMEGIRTMMKVFFKEGITTETMRKVFSLQLFDSSLVTETLLEERRQIAELQPKRVLSTLEVPNLTGELANIRCPVLGLWGTEDKFCPVSGATTLAKNIADARVEMLSKTGHWVMVERAEFFNRVCLEFLREKASS